MQFRYLPSRLIKSGLLVFLPCMEKSAHVWLSTVTVQFVGKLTSLQDTVGEALVVLMLVHPPQLLGDILYPIVGQLCSGGCQLNVILTVSDSFVILVRLMLLGGDRGST